MAHGLADSQHDVEHEQFDSGSISRVGGMIYGSGLRSGFANTDHVPPYAQFNIGASREFQIPNTKPFTVRVAVINVFDKIYELRDGSGIGVSPRSSAHAVRIFYRFRSDRPHA